MSVIDVIYVAASKISVMIVTVVKCPEDVSTMCEYVLNAAPQTSVVWSHNTSVVTPLILHKDLLETIETHFPFLENDK